MIRKDRRTQPDIRPVQSSLSYLGSNGRGAEIRRANMWPHRIWSESTRPETVMWILDSPTCGLAPVLLPAEESLSALLWGFVLLLRTLLLGVVALTLALTLFFLRRVLSERDGHGAKREGKSQHQRHELRHGGSPC